MNTPHERLTALVQQWVGQYPRPLYSHSRALSAHAQAFEIFTELESLLPDLALQGEAGSQAQQEWKCKARLSTDPPQDCDWPQCGCDPYADKVLAAISEAGFAIIREAQVATLQQERKLLLDAVNFEDRPDSLHTLGLDFLKRGELLEKTLAYVVALLEQLAALQAQIEQERDERDRNLDAVAGTLRHLEAENTRLQAQIAQQEQERQRFRRMYEAYGEVISWALGEGESTFQGLPDDWPKRKFYWREELRVRADKAIAAASLAAPQEEK